VVGVAANPAPV